MPEITALELTLLLCATCLSLASMMIWACYQIAPRLVTARSRTRADSRKR
jgi:hypothetical protein